MSMSYPEAMTLLDDTKALIVSSQEQYLGYLTTAARNYKYTALEQVMIYAQRPNATACASYDIWRRLGRWVYRGTPGIAIPTLDGTKNVSYIWNVADTGGSRFISLWAASAAYEPAIREMLVANYGVSDSPMMLPMLKEAVAVTVAAALADERLRSTMESLSSRVPDVDVARLVTDSVTYMVLVRCGYSVEYEVKGFDFSGIQALGQTEQLDDLLLTISGTAKDILRDIELTVKSESKNLRRNIATTQNQGYGKDERHEGSEEYGKDHVQGVGGSSSAEHPVSATQGTQFLRERTPTLSEGGRSSSVRSDGLPGDAVSAPGGDRPAGAGDVGDADREERESSRPDGRAEAGRSDEVGRPDDQHPGRGPGDRDEGAYSDLIVEGKDEEPEIPPEAQQIEEAQEAEGGDPSAFTISQEDIDAALTTGSGMEHGKYRIFEQFQKHEDAATNIAFLKSEYGCGGRWPIICNGKEILEDHDSKGIRLRLGLSGDPGTDILLKWPKIETRLRYLNDNDRYLNEAEKAKYPEYLALQEVRKMRRDLSDQFDELVRGYNEFQRESGNTDAMLNNYGLVIGASNAFLLGEKISYLLPAENPYVLPAMRAALEQLIRSGYQVDRTQLLLQELRVNPACTYLEPTEEELEELRKPPEKMIYRIEVGTKFYLGSRSFEVVGMAGDEIRYCDSSFPIMQSTLSYAALTERLAESPLNDDLLIPESSLQSQAPVSSLMSGESVAAKPTFESPITISAEDGLIATDFKEYVRCAVSPEPLWIEMSDETNALVTSMINDGKISPREAMNVGIRSKVGPKGIWIPTENDNYQYNDNGSEGYRFPDAENMAQLIKARYPDRFQASGQDESAPSIDHFYVAKDITAPDIGITEYPTLEEALAAYRSLPMDTTKALGAQNDKPMPGSLDFIQCVYDSNTGLHRDVLITDYLRLPDWDTQEVDEIVERIELFLDLEQPELPEDILEEAKQRINEFSQKEFELDADFTNPSCVGIAYSSTEDGEHEIQVNVDLPGRAILFYVDNQVVSEVKCSDSDFLAYLGNLDFSELIDFADQEYEAQKEEPESHADEMIRQAQLAAQLSEETGQNIFAFEAGNPNPINAPQPAAPARPRTTAAPFTLHPEVPTSARHDYRIADDDLGVGTPSERFRNNVAAIRLLKKLEAEDRLATADEQDILAKYVGWGGLSACFEERHSRYQELKALLTDAEYEAARESTLTAFYTPPIVIRAMYQVLANLGFHEGNVLEPSCGIGHFIGSLPDSMSAAKMYGVELDSISGRIAQQLYQNQNIAVQGYEKTDLPDSFFDVAIGNVPFGQFKVPDRRYDKHNFQIHDYFFAKTLDKVRPGGVVAFITSKGTLDKENMNVRKYIAQRADLLGAIRLPNDTFKSAAGTEVTSDIIFLKKRDSLAATEPDWVYIATDENGIRMNRYFVDHPEMILGEMKEVSGPYGPEAACLPSGDTGLAERLNEAIRAVRGKYEAAAAAYEDVEVEDTDTIPADLSVRNLSYTIAEDGKLYYRNGSTMSLAKVSKTAEQRIRGLVLIRDAARDLINVQTEGYPDSVIKESQKVLNERYDKFVDEFGYIGSKANRTALQAESSRPLLLSLEYYDDGNYKGKADIFSKRTIRAKEVVTSCESASEALIVSLSEKARIDMDYMMSLTGKTEQDLFRDLRGVIFLNPEHTREDDGRAKYLPADEYLSGNVREKLELARRCARYYPDDYTPNVIALEAVQPKDLEATEIFARLGSTWIPEDVIKDFVFEILETPWRKRYQIDVKYASITGEWHIENKGCDRGNVTATSTYGTTRINGYYIIENSLNLRDVKIYDHFETPDGKQTRVLNQKETTIAQAKQEQINIAFEDWIWRDQRRRDRLVKLYNEKFNSTRPREYDGSHLTFPGMNPEIQLREHQLNAIARILYGGNTLLGHVVGAGKTFEMVAAAQESKRLGLCQKSLIVVPNHLTEQWATEYMQLYPSANILVAQKRDFETAHRKEFCSRIATGDFDAIIIGHSQFEKIPLSRERQTEMLYRQKDELLQAIEQSKRRIGEDFTVKQLERAKKSIELKLEKLNDQSRKDDIVTFEQLGVDRLFVDEAHYYKNLAAFTKMQNVGGISQTEAMKSSDLYMKCQYLDEITGGHGVIFATGTPISNTMVEMFTMQRYLQSGTLRRNNLEHFDAWASTFGETVTAIELAPEGTGYRAKTRFARFHNLPELMTMFKEVADIQTADMLNLPVPHMEPHYVALKPSEIQKQFVESLSKRADRVRNRQVSSDKDNMLLITNDGRKLALDQRLLDPMLPDDPNGKVSTCANNVYQIWKDTESQRLTQLVFCDLSTPKNDGRFSVYNDLKAKLIARGVPAEEIAFIHDAPSERKKQELFGKVRSGQVRVLIGSTQMMGAGTNVQRLLIAEHHLDCPWRPSDLQQREGRIVRQGNLNETVHIYTYVTEDTFDAYLYQLVESKQKFIGQIMTSKSPVRAAEDVDEGALSYAEIKALCSGNPAIREKMDLDVSVQKLRLLRANHLSEQYRLEDQIAKYFPAKIADCKALIEKLEKDIALRDQHLPKAVDESEEESEETADGTFSMTIRNQVYTEKKAAGQMLLQIMPEITGSEPEEIGTYAGFKMSLTFDYFNKVHKMYLDGAVSHIVTLSDNVHGNIVRINTVLRNIEKQLEISNEQLETLNDGLNTAKAGIGKPFPYEEELRTQSARLNELNIMLNLDRPENDAVTEATEEGEDPGDMKIEAPDLPYDVVLEPLYDEPESSMWGEIDSCTRLANGIFSVSTPSHGGTMVRMELRKHFSDIVWSIGVDDGIYHCYEEDCAEAVVLREMIDKGIMVVPPWQLHDVEAFEASINQTCEQWNPEYWSWRTKQIENDPNYPQHHLIQMPIPEEDMEMGDD